MDKMTVKARCRKTQLLMNLASYYADGRYKRVASAHADALRRHLAYNEAGGRAMLGMEQDDELRETFELVLDDNSNMVNAASFRTGPRTVERPCERAAVQGRRGAAGEPIVRSPRHCTPLANARVAAYCGYRPSGSAFRVTAYRREFRKTAEVDHVPQFNSVVDCIKGNTNGISALHILVPVLS